MLNFFTLKGQKGEHLSTLSVLHVSFSVPLCFTRCFFPSLHPLAHRKFELVWINPDITNSGFWDMILFNVIVWFTEIKFNIHLKQCYDYLNE